MGTDYKRIGFLADTHSAVPHAADDSAGTVAILDVSKKIALAKIVSV